MSVMMLPLEDAFGWRRDVISLAAAVGIFIYGLAGPFAAALMERIGLRRTLLAALLLMSGSTALSLLMTEPWHLIATWGVLSGIGSGAVATVLGATIVNRWFKTNRGLMMGLMSASAATGLLVFLPLLAMLAQHGRLEAGGDRRFGRDRRAAAAGLAAGAGAAVLDRADALRRRRAGAGGCRRPRAISSTPTLRRCARRPARGCSGICSPPSSSAASPPTAWSARI